MMIAVSGVSYAKCFPSRKVFLVENFHVWISGDEERGFPF